MAGLQMLDIDRKQSALSVGITKLAKTFDPVAVVLWLRTVQDCHHNNGYKMSFDEPTRMFLIGASARAIGAMSAMSEPGRLLLEVVIKACSMPARGDFDENLELINKTLVQAKVIEAHKGKLKLVYTMRRPPGERRILILSLRSNVYGAFGLKAGLLVTNALLSALKRERNREVFLDNPPVPKVFDPIALRSAPRYESWIDSEALDIFNTHVLQLSVDEIQANLKLIKAVRDHYIHLELPEPVAQQPTLGME